VWWDERRPAGRVRGLLFLLHPGPSLLVTATFVAIGCLAVRGLPGGFRALQLAGLMLPIQFAIGVSNDVCDLTADAATQPYKPLVRGMIGPRAAAALAVGLAVVGLVVAATISLGVQALAAGGLAAGLAYNLGLGRTPLSMLPWWAAFVLLPVAAYMAVARSVPGIAVLVPLAGVLALSLHCANALPDIPGDRAQSRRSLPVLLGIGGSRAVSLLASLLAAILAVVLSPVLGQDVALVAAGAGCVGLAVALCTFGGSSRPFPLLAVAGAALAVTWLAALPAA